MNTIYFDGVAVGQCETLPVQERLTKELPTISTTFSWRGTIQIKSGKKRRRWARWLRELAMSERNRNYIHHYRRVKQHQLRKRLLKK